MPWNEITPGCSVLYWGPISKCPMYNRSAIGLTRHTVLWANCQDTEHPGMGSLQGVPSYTRGPYPSVLCTIGQQSVRRGTLEYGPTVRTWNTLEWDNSRMFHPILGVHIQVSCVRLVGNWSDAAHWNMGRLSGHGPPWNGIVPGCSILYQGPISKCPVYHRSAIGLTQHTGLWVNHHDTKHPSLFLCSVLVTILW